MAITLHACGGTNSYKFIGLSMPCRRAARRRPHWPPARQAGLAVVQAAVAARHPARPGRLCCSSSCGAAQPGRASSNRSQQHICLVWSGQHRQQRQPCPTPAQPGARLPFPGCPCTASAAAAAGHPAAAAGAAAAGRPAAAAAARPFGGRQRQPAGNSWLRLFHWAQTLQQRGCSAGAASQREEAQPGGGRQAALAHDRRVGRQRRGGSGGAGGGGGAFLACGWAAGSVRAQQRTATAAGAAGGGCRGQQRTAAGARAAGGGRGAAQRSVCGCLCSSPQPAGRAAGGVS